MLSTAERPLWNDAVHRQGSAKGGFGPFAHHFGSLTNGSFVRTADFPTLGMLRGA